LVFSNNARRKIPNTLHPT